MGTSDHSSRSSVLVSLAGFVVVFGTVSWVVSGGIGRHSSLVSHPPAVTPGQTPPVCRSNQLQIFGAFNDCAGITSSFCEVSAQTLDNVFVLHGVEHDFTLNLGALADYIGGGDYGLNNGAAEVDVRENTTNARWLSSTGVLVVTANSGRAGTIYANLDPWAGNPVNLTSLPLRIQGSWSCA